MVTVQKAKQERLARLPLRRASDPEGHGSRWRGQRNKRSSVGTRKGFERLDGRSCGRTRLRHSASGAQERQGEDQDATPKMHAALLPTPAMTRAGRSRHYHWETNI